MKVKITVLFLLISVVSYGQVSFTFSLANGQVTNDGSKDYYEFDVMVSAGSNTQFEVAQVYLNYNTAGFGSNIVSNGKVTITKGSPLLDVVFDGDIGSYTIQSADNTSSILALSNNWQKTDLGGGKTGYDLTNTLGSSAVVWIHVKIEIADPNESSGVSFNTTISQWDQQDYHFTSGDTHEKYSPVSASGSLDEPLPVELTSFTSSVTEIVNLEWETATETNNFGFDVERAVLNEDSSKTWEKIGFVEGAGNSNSRKSYHFEDRRLPNVAKLYYRLKQIDNDGKFSYSKSIEVDISTITSVEEPIPTEYSLSQNYPNPFNPTTKIKFSLPESAKVLISIYNSIGQKLFTLVNKQFSAGNHEINFNGYELSSGVYFYRILAGEFTSIKKMILIK